MIRNPTKAPTGRTAARAPDVPAVDAPGESDVRAQLDKIVASAAFTAAAQIAGLLRFIVEETLAGRHDRLKAYTIGLEVFQRPASFDPQTDSIVRVEASRLRRRLELYYLGDGRDDAVRIDLPPGTYVPRFTRAPHLPHPIHGPTDAPAAARRRRWPVFVPAAVVVVVLGAIAAWVFFGSAADRAGTAATTAESGERARETRGPAIAVSAFRSLDGGADQQHFGSGMTEEVIARLTRFRDLHVFRARWRPGSEHDLDQIRAQARDVGARFVVEGTVRHDAERLTVTAGVLSAASGEYLWATRYERALTVGGLIEIEEDIAQHIVAAIAQPYGVLSRAAMTGAARQHPASLQAYECVLRAMHYWAELSAANHASGRDCLERAVELDPDYATAWAYLAYFYIDEHRWRFNPRSEPPPMTRAARAARRAVALDPDSAIARLALSAVAYFSNDIPTFKAMGEAALRLNPSNGEHMASYGSRLAYSGDWERGLELVRNAMALNPWHPDWYALAFIVDACRRGDYRTALQEWNKISLPDFYLYRVLGVIIHAQLGQTDAAAAERAALLRLYPDFARHARAEFETGNLPRSLAEPFLAALRRGGLDVGD